LEVVEQRVVLLDLQEQIQYFHLLHQQVVVAEELMQFQDLLVYQVDLEVVEVEDVLQQQVQETLLLQVLLKEIVVEQVVLLLLLVVAVVEQQQQDVLDHQVKVEMVEMVLQIVLQELQHHMLVVEVDQEMILMVEQEV
jgi:hypothetical protein